MHFYLCLREEAHEGPLKSFRWDHCCIPHYWLWDLAQSGRIPSHIAVQRLGLMFKKKTKNTAKYYSHPSELINHVLPRGGDKAAQCLRKKTHSICSQNANFIPSSRYKRMKMSSPQIQMLGPSRDVPVWLWSLQSPERIILLWQPGESISSVCILSPWPTLNTHRLGSVHSGTVTAR